MFNEEEVKVDKLYGHGGFFKTEEVGQRIMSAACGGPVTVMKTAGEGGAWGIALLALFSVLEEKTSLADYLNNVIFAGEEGTTITADAGEVEGFDKFMETFKATLPVEKAAIAAMKQ